MVDLCLNRSAGSGLQSSLLFRRQFVVLIRTRHRHAHFPTRKFNVVFLESVPDAVVDFLAQRELRAGFGHELTAHNNANVVKLENTLAFERLQKIIFEKWIFQHFSADLLEDFLDLIRISVERHREHQLHNHPVAAEVGYFFNAAIRNRVYIPPMMTQLHGPDRYLFDRTHGAAHIDVFTHAKCIVDKKEHPRYNIGHQFLGTKSDGQTKDTSASQKRCDIDAQSADRKKRKDCTDSDLRCDQHHGQNGCKARTTCAATLARSLIRGLRCRLLTRQLAVYPK